MREGLKSLGVLERKVSARSLQSLCRCVERGGGEKMKPNDTRNMTKEEYIAHQLAFVAKYTKVQLKPKPTAEQKAERAWQKQPLTALAQTNRQSNKLLVERTKAELDEAERQRQREQFNRLAQITNERAVELGYFQRQMDALASRRYDPTGNWGPPNYRADD